MSNGDDRFEEYVEIKEGLSTAFVVTSLLFRDKLLVPCIQQASHP